MDGRMKVYHRRGERFTDACVVEADHYRRGSVMVWGGIHFNGKLDPVIINGILNAQRYREQVLRPVVVQYINTRPAANFIFQQFNARPDVARENQAYFNQNGIAVLPWPALSADMSHIEHLWDMLDRAVRQRHVQPRNVQ